MSERVFKVKGGLLILRSGSVLDFKGDAIVNAANEGCTGGFGVDEAINKAGGFALKQARKELGGCTTGSAKVTPSFYDNITWIIHAVGPVYRIPFGLECPNKQEFLSKKDKLLYSAYKDALTRANEKGVRTLGFSLLCAGVFRGERDLTDILQIGIQTIVDHFYEGLESVVMYAFTEEEYQALNKAATACSLI